MSFLCLIFILFLYSCGGDDKDENRLKSDAVLEWRGEYEIDGCGFFILMNDKEYKPVNEEIIDNSFKSGNTNIIIEYELSDKKIETLCYDSHSPIEYAGIKGVELTETTIALDAFVFVVNKENPIKTLTVDQIRKIYTGEISNWSEAGGNNADIKVFTRPRNSGSEEVFRELVMNGCNRKM